MQASRLPTWRLVALSYSDLWRALRAMPVLFGCAILIFLAARIAEELLPVQPWSESPFGLLAVTLEDAVRYFCLTPVMIAIHRFIIRGEVTRRYVINPTERSFMLFFAWTMAISILFWLVLTFSKILMGKMSAAGQLPLAALVTFLILILPIAAIWVSMRLTIIFPAIAVGASGAKAANAFADTKGYNLRLLAIFLLAFLPMIALTILITIGLGRGIMLQGSPLSVFEAFMSAVVATIVDALGVVIASHIYLAIGRKVRG